MTRRAVLGRFSSIMTVSRFFFQAEDGIRDLTVTGVQTCALPIYAAIRQLPGIGPVPGAVIVAEIGDVSRFGKPGQLCSWAGLTPRHHESGTRVIREIGRASCRERG